MTLKIDDRMKNYELSYRMRLMPKVPFVVRLDGRGFSRYTKKMKFKKPFDDVLVEVMQNVTKRLMIENKAILAYTQSDEITLIFQPEQMEFSGRVEKICSILAAQTSVMFSQEMDNVCTMRIQQLKDLEKQSNNQVDLEKSKEVLDNLNKSGIVFFGEEPSEDLPNVNYVMTGLTGFKSITIEHVQNYKEQQERLFNMINRSKQLLPVFDCRVFSVPNPIEALNAVLWREQDAIKNSVQVLAQSLFSHKELHKLNGKQLKEKMRTEKNINWDDLPLELRRGTYFIRRKLELDVAELYSWFNNATDIEKQNNPEKIKQYKTYLQDIPEKHLMDLVANKKVIERPLYEQDTSFEIMMDVKTKVKHNEAEFIKFFGFNTNNQ